MVVILGSIARLSRWTMLIGLRHALGVFPHHRRVGEGRQIEEDRHMGLLAEARVEKVRWTGSARLGLRLNGLRGG